MRYQAHYIELGPLV